MPQTLALLPILISFVLAYLTVGLLVSMCCIALFSGDKTVDRGEYIAVIFVWPYTFWQALKP